MRERALLAISRILRVPVSTLNDESNAASIISWDSLHHMQVIMALEEEFDVQFDATEVNVLKNLGELLKMLQEIIDEKWSKKPS